MYPRQWSNFQYIAAIEKLNRGYPIFGEILIRKYE